MRTWIDYTAAVRALATGTISDPELGDSRFVSSARINSDLNRLSWFSTTPYLSILLAPKLAPDSNNWIWLPEDAFATAFAPNASADDQAVLAAVQRPLSLACITVPAGRPLWKDVPTWFLLAEQDRMIVADTARFMAERMKAKVKAHAVDHTPSVTAPVAVVYIIRDAIHSVTGNRGY